MEHHTTITKIKEVKMKRIEEIWKRLDLGTKLGIWCFVTYLLLYGVLDILEELLGVAF